MKTIITKTIALLLASGLAMSAHNSAAATELWYEDNNMGKAGGIPADFFDNQPALFSIQGKALSRTKPIKENVSVED